MKTARGPIQYIRLGELIAYFSMSAPGLRPTARLVENSLLVLSPNNTAAATSAGRRRPPRVSLHSLSLIPLDHIARAGVSSPSARIRSFRRAQRQPLGTLGAIENPKREME